MAVDASGNLTADQDARSTDHTGMIRDRVRKIGKRAAVSDTQVVARTVDELRTHAVETVIKGGFAVPLAAYNTIRREAWMDGYDRGYADCADAAQELLNAERDGAAATS